VRASVLLDLARKIARRFGYTLFVIWAVVSVSFLLTYALPGDAALTVAGPHARPKDVQNIRVQMGLDQPLRVQYIRFFKHIIHVGPASVPAQDKQHRSCSTWGRVHLDLGYSYQYRTPVLKLLVKKFPATLMLASSAMFVQIVIGLVAGTWAAARHRRWPERLITLATLFGISTPTFLTGIFLQYTIAYRWHWLPLDGFGQTTTEKLLHVILPALTLGLLGSAYYTRLVKVELFSQINQDYIRTARAKGASVVRVTVVHMLRNSLIPLITAVGLDLGALLGGAVVTETMFRWPGLGQLSAKAVMDRDGPLILGTVLLAALSIVLTNMFVDFLYTLLDPRLRNQQ
jgi:peptide/nickel transport system permease protein